MAKNEYDPTVHSKNKLGAVGGVPYLPMMPTGAQVLNPWQVHYKLMGDSYVKGQLPSVPPASLKTVVAAIKALPNDDPSYSHSGTAYKRLSIEPHADGRTFTLKAGETAIGIGLVDPNAPIVSTDEPMQDQIDGGDDPVNGEGDIDGDFGDLG
jgi:hypothetical protein